MFRNIALTILGLVLFSTSGWSQSLEYLIKEKFSENHLTVVADPGIITNRDALPEHFLAKSSPSEAEITKIKTDLSDGKSMIGFQRGDEQLLGVLISVSNYEGPFAIVDVSTGEILRSITLSGLDRSIFIQFKNEKVAAVFNQSEAIKINTISTYTILESASRMFGFGAKFDCHIDIGCPEAAAYTKHEQGATRIFMVLEEGIGFCTGALMNNTAQDKTPYVLTAFHCFDGYTPVWDEWRFEFGLEAIQCDAMDASPALMKVFGAEDLAGSQVEDFVLLKIQEQLDLESMPIAFLGWDRTPQYFPDTAALIHHPQGDLKKIAFNFDKLTHNPNPIFWSNGVDSEPRTHYMCHFEEGTHENGSSGGPLMDHKGYVIGQLHGGKPECEDRLAFFGMLSRAWDGTNPQSRLKDWLDPLGQNPFRMEPMFSSNSADVIEVNGTVITPNHQPVPDVMVTISGTAVGNMTAVNGRFSIEYLNNGFDGTLSAEKAGEVKNGVNILDLILILKHILGLQPFTSNLQYIAADVDLSGSVNILDVIKLKRLLIDLDTDFDHGQNWNFYPSPMDIDPDNPNDMVITAVKLGDVDHSADPTK